MATQTSTPIQNYLSPFDETWILKMAGAGNQIDRRKALTQAREDVSAIPSGDSQWLLNHLRNSIAPELSNPQPYETEVRLQLIAYAIIHHLRRNADTSATLAILAIRSNELTRICNGGTIN